jgi:hypothetical protein
MAMGQRIQGGVSGMESGVGTVLLRGLLYAVLCVAILGGYAASQFQGLRDAEAMELSHVARNIAAGEGYTTLCVRPFDMWYLKQSLDDVSMARIPDLHHPPAYPVLLSGVYKLIRPSYSVSQGGRLFDAEYKAIVPLGIVLTALCALVLFLLGRHLFGVRVAGLSVVVFLISNVTLGSAVSGLPVPLLSLVVTLVCTLGVYATQCSAKEGRRGAQLLYVGSCAVLSAVAILTDYTMIAVAVAIVVLLAVQLQRLRWVSILFYVLVAGLCVMPWLLHNHNQDIGLLGAKPYTAVSGTTLYANDSLFKAVAPEFNAYRVGRAIRLKMFSFVTKRISARGALGGGIIICFFILSLFHRYEDPVVSALKWFVLGGLGLMTLLVPLVGPSYNVVIALFPLVALFGASAFTDYVDREEYFDRSIQTLLVWGLVLVTALPVIGQVMSRPDSVFPPYYAPLQRYVCSLIDKDELLYSDIPWATAWYGDRSSVLIPNAISDVDSTLGGWSSVGGVYLTSETGDRPLQGDPSWRQLLQGKVPDAVPFRHAIELPSGRPNQLFLTDRARWDIQGE